MALAALLGVSLRPSLSTCSPPMPPRRLRYPGRRRHFMFWDTVTFCSFSCFDIRTVASNTRFLPEWKNHVWKFVILNHNQTAIFVNLGIFLSISPFVNASKSCSHSTLAKFEDPAFPVLVTGDIFKVGAKISCLLFTATKMALLSI